MTVRRRRPHAGGETPRTRGVGRMPRGARTRFETETTGDDMLFKDLPLWAHFFLPYDDDVCC